MLHHILLLSVVTVKSNIYLIRNYEDSVNFVLYLMIVGWNKKLSLDHPHPWFNWCYLSCCWLKIIFFQGAGHDRSGIYIKSVVKGGAADAVKCILIIWIFLLEE